MHAEAAKEGPCLPATRNANIGSRYYPPTTTGSLSSVHLSHSFWEAQDVTWPPKLKAELSSRCRTTEASQPFDGSRTALSLIPFGVRA